MVRNYIHEVHDGVGGARFYTGLHICWYTGTMGLTLLDYVVYIA